MCSVIKTYIVNYSFTAKCKKLFQRYIVELNCYLRHINPNPKTLINSHNANEPWLFSVFISVAIAEDDANRVEKKKVACFSFAGKVSIFGIRIGRYSKKVARIVVKQ